MSTCPICDAIATATTAIPVVGPVVGAAINVLVAALGPHPHVELRQPPAESEQAQIDAEEDAKEQARFDFEMAKDLGAIARGDK